MPFLSSVLSSFLVRPFRSPLLHFLLLGAVLFVAARLWGSGAAEDFSASQNLQIQIETTRQEELRNTFLEQMGRAPSEGEFRAMLSAEMDEEILFREALARGLLERDGGVKTRLVQKMLFLEGRTDIEDAPALLERAKSLGLHEGDLVVRRILVQKMRLLASTLAPDARPNAQDIETAYEAQGENLREPDRRSITQIFFSTDRRPDSAQNDAERARNALIQEDTVEASEGSTLPLGALGDPFPLGHVFERRSERDLDRSFGAHFGSETFDTEVGLWSKPIESAYGFHLVRVDREQNGEIPPLETVRDRLRHQLEQERREQQLENLLSDLRTRYEIVLTPSANRFPTSETGSTDTNAKTMTMTMKEAR